MGQVLIAALVLALAALVACGDNRASEAPKDAATTNDAAASQLAPCVDRPSDVPRPPIGPLPCELVPPGVAP